MNVPAKDYSARSQRNGAYSIPRIILTMLLIVAVGMGMFLLFYNRYNDGILYAERLNQMQDITSQLFVGLEDVVGDQWRNVQVLCNYVEQAKPATAEQLRQFMAAQTALNDLDAAQDQLIAVDDNGRYYTTEGLNGTLQELNYLLDEPARISYVSNTLTTNRTKMVYLERLAEPALLADGSTLVYYGIARDMTVLEPYFDCAAYEGSSGVYVLDRDGLKLFSSRSTSEDGSALIQGYNVYHVLEKMQYRHGSSFDAARSELEQNGLSYSNAVLNGDEYYYSMYRMENAEWTLLFLVDSDAVATNTVELVETTTKLLLAFAVFMIAVSSVSIYFILHRQQQKELQIVEENSAALAAANEKLEQYNVQLENSNKQLERAQEATAEALEVARNASKAKTDFLSNMSHDIRTPMNAIVGITTLMKNELHEPEKIQEHLEKLEFSSQHLLGILNDILDMSRIESGQAQLNISKMSLADQIAQVDSIIRPQAAQRSQNFTIATTHLKHEKVLADPTRLNKVLVNLLSNAVKYTPSGGHILLDVEELPNNTHYAKYRFTVQDDGIGMSPEFLSRIYEPFTRAENSVTNKVQGTGLGMSITKSVVDLMGGTIHVESEPDKGSRFEVTLVFPIDAEAEGNVQSMKLLLYRCDAENYARIQDAVEGKPIRLTVAQEPEEAAALLRKSSYDVVLLSLEHPGLAGLVQQLRQAAQPDTIFLGVATGQQDGALDEAASGGLDGFLPLPFFLSNLEEEVVRVREEQKESDEQEQASPLSGMKFLCAEDNAINAEILEMLLEMKGASCKICSNGKELVDFFEGVQPGDYDVILMDVQMPVMNGLDATRAIRQGKNPLGATIPIVAMTANAFVEDIQQSRDAGMDEHLSKPLDIKVLEQTMKRFRTAPPRKGKSKIS